jgi:hypothetical protein
LPHVHQLPAVQRRYLKERFGVDVPDFEFKPDTYWLRRAGGAQCDPPERISASRMHRGALRHGAVLGETEEWHCRPRFATHNARSRRSARKPPKHGKTVSVA